MKRETGRAKERESREVMTKLTHANGSTKGENKEWENKMKSRKLTRRYERPTKVGKILKGE